MPTVLLLAAIALVFWLGRRTAPDRVYAASGDPLDIVDPGKPGHPLAFSPSELDMLRKPVSETDPQGLRGEIGKGRRKR